MKAGICHCVCWVACCLFVEVPAASAADNRTWTSTEGKTLQGALVRLDGENVIIKMTDGRLVPVPKSRLSEPDLRYLVDHPALQPKPAAVVSSKSSRGLSAKDAKVDTKSFERKKKELDIGAVVFDVIDTPHFCVAYLGTASNPEGTAESAERLWQEMSSQFGTFSQNWGDKRLVIFLAEKAAIWEAIGKWYRDSLKKARPDDEKVRRTLVTSAATWSKDTANSIELDAEFVQKYHTLQEGIAFNTSDTALYKGLWAPYRINILATSPHFSPKQHACVVKMS